MASTNSLNINSSGVVVYDSTTGVFAESTINQHETLVGGTSNAIVSIATGTAGFVLTSNGAAADPSYQDISATGVITTITGNSGGAESPSAGNFNILGTGSITVAGSANTETVQLTGITNHAVQIGAGTATLTQLGAGTTGQVLQTNTGADPTWSTATYPSSTNINRILYSTANNVIGELATANRAVLTTGATGVPVLTALATDGQLIIGSTAGVPAAATLTQGSGISITNGSNSITISATAGGLAWVDVTGTTQTIAVNTAYLANNAGLVTFTLPATAAQFSEFRIAGHGAGGWTVAQNANQQIIFGNSATTAGVTGSISSNNANDCFLAVASVGGASTIWTVLSSVGNLNIV